MKGAFRQALPGEELGAADVPRPLPPGDQTVRAERREVGSVNRIDPDAAAEDEDAPAPGHPQDLDHVGEVPRRVDGLARDRRGGQLPGEGRLGPRQPGRALLAPDDVDEAEASGAVALGGAEDGEIGPVVDVPGVRPLPGDAERGDDGVGARGDSGGDAGVRDVPDDPFVDEALQAGGLPRARRDGPIAVANDGADPVPTAVQLGDDEASEVTGGPGDEDGRGHGAS